MPTALLKSTYDHLCHLLQKLNEVSKTPPAAYKMYSVRCWKSSHKAWIYVIWPTKSPLPTERLSVLIPALGPDPSLSGHLNTALILSGTLLPTLSLRQYIQCNHHCLVEKSLYHKSLFWSYTCNSSQISQSSLHGRDQKDLSTIKAQYKCGTTVCK